VHPIEVAVVSEIGINLAKQQLKGCNLKAHTFQARSHLLRLPVVADAIVEELIR